MKETKMSNYEVLYEISNTVKGVWFDHIEGYSCMGDYGSDAPKHPIQYVAKTNVREGDDDPFEGVGWTPSEALRSLLKVLQKEIN